MILDPLLELVAILLVAMVALWMLSAIPGDSTIKAIIRVIVIGVLSIWAILDVLALLRTLIATHRL